jgi:uncharacterized membrane protein YdbT with pleckstrin-like domain
MRYVDSVLQPGEAVRHVSSLHWTLYAPGALLWIAAAVIALARPDAATHWIGHAVAVAAAWLCFATGVVLITRAWFKWWTTEIAVTDRRVVSKTGFIWRNTTEMHMDKVESVEVKQSILGRIFDYGDVEIRGVGAGLEPLRMIARPLELRNRITAT